MRRRSARRGGQQVTVIDDALSWLDELPEETLPTEPPPVDYLHVSEAPPGPSAEDLAAAPYDLGAFARCVLGDGYVDGAWLVDLRDNLMWFAEEVRLRRSPRLMIEAPPRHGKSTNAIELLATWMLCFIMRGRKFEIICVSATHKSVVDRSTNSRDLMREAMALGLAPGLGFKKEAETYWKTSDGGSFYSSGVKGTIVSKGADVLFIDDIVKGYDEASSPARREKTWRKFTGDIRDRLMPGGGLLWMGTRWNLDDAQGRALERSAHEGWRRLTYRALARADDDRQGAGDHRLPGQPLHPQRWPIKALNDLRLTITRADWMARFEQDPISEGNREWKREWFRFHTPGQPTPDNAEKGWKQTPLFFDLLLVTADLTMGSESEAASFSVIHTWGVKGNDLFLLHERRAKMDYVESRAELIAAVKQAYAEAKGARVVPIVEAKALGITLLRELKGTIPSLMADGAIGSKKVRARAAAPVIEQGRVYLPLAASWAQECLDELADHPEGKHNDRGDAAGIAIRTQNAAAGGWSGAIA